jgi:Na+/phosphate symporter
MTFYYQVNVIYLSCIRNHITNMRTENGNNRYSNFHLYLAINASIIFIVIVALFLSIYSSFTSLKSDAQTLNFSTDIDTDFVPLQSSTQTLADSLNDTMKIQQQIQRISKLSSQQIQQDLQMQLLELQQSEEQLQQRQKLLPQLSLQSEQEELVNQLQTLQQLILLPPDQQQKILNQKLQALNVTKQTLIQQQQTLQASEQQLQTLQQLISLPRDQQQKVFIKIQQLLTPEQGVQ